MIRILFFFLLVGIVGCKEAPKTPIVKVVPARICPNDTLPTVEKNKIVEQYNLEAKRVFIDSLMEAKIDTEVFNGSVLVAYKGVVLYNKQVGFANVDKTIPLNEHSKFHIASISKTFTGVAILQLYEKGKIRLEQTIQDFFPTFPYPGVTIQMLLSHRSGLPKYEYVFDDKVAKDSLYPTNSDIIEWFSSPDNKVAVYNDPNTKFLYNNMNFLLLASIVEKVSNVSFKTYIQKNIFDPLCMKDTYIITHEDSIKRNIPLDLTEDWKERWSRKKKKNKKEIDSNFFDNIVGDKGVYSTTHDLYIWYNALFKNRLLKKITTDKAFTPYSFEKKGLKNYGLGFRIWTNKNQETDFVYHTGWWGGYNAIMWFDPKVDMVAIGLSNNSNKGIYKVRNLLYVLEDGRNTEEKEEEF